MRKCLRKKLKEDAVDELFTPALFASKAQMYYLYKHKQRSNDYNTPAFLTNAKKHLQFI